MNSNIESVSTLYKNISKNFLSIHNAGNMDSAKKLAQLLQKLEDMELTIAFCGHFSAGKSTFINELLQEQVLPSSPIPTSANVVTIKKGTEKAIVHFFEDESLEILPPIRFEKVKEYCKAGDKVESVLYQYPFENIDQSLVILDTPGIDSTDDAHRVSTESALHLADVVFYVMDYNHVQSEVNLQFIKDLQLKGKQLYLIINQIDKHQETELPFFVYKERIVQSLRDWDIKKCPMFFTSLKNKGHALNELEKVKSLVSDLIQKKNIIISSTTKTASETIIQEHTEWQYAQNEAQLEKLEPFMQEGVSLEHLKELLHEKQNNYDNIVQSENLTEKSFYNEVQKILDNANITPFETRELAKNYIEAMQKDFKVGLLFSKKKTEEEREKRAQILVQDFKERVQTQVEKHIQDFVLSFIKEEGFTSPTWMQNVQSISIELNENFLVNHIKQGAGTSGDAVLNYTKDIANTVRKEFKILVKDMISPIFSKMREQQAEENKFLKEEITKLQQTILAQEQYELIVKRIKDEKDELEKQMLATNNNDIDRTELTDAKNKYVLHVAKVLRGDQLEDIDITTEKEVIESDENRDNELIHTGSTEQTIKKLNSVSQQLLALPTFEKIAEELVVRAKKLNNQSFTVALFGAFSAGKSSFANALFGEKILPVSPNPTTASINKISPVTDEFVHGTVHVNMKTESDLLEDVQLALSYFQLEAKSLEEAKEQVSKLSSLNNVDSKVKPHISFLQAFAKGFDEMKQNVGKLLTINLNSFEEYVSTEEKACFVEWIEVFYDCPLTQEGITLVDTPGADSVNARHTEVSFEYIKNSDAILFVTYYQHAFSKADREFLIQLGRVKDAFSLDKMFFIVNAADLANTKEELDLVTNYVEDQLLSYGIRNPRLFALSSLHALAEKRGEKNLPLPSFMNGSQIFDFEQKFYQFIKNDLVEMSNRASIEELNRVYRNVEALYNAAIEGEEAKKAKLNHYQSNELKMLDSLNAHSVSDYGTLLNKEIKELVYYVNQRLFLRYRDFFKEAFNPSVLRDDRNIKEQLQMALKELIGDIEHDLAQEVRATTVRLEKFLEKIMVTYQENFKVETHKIDEKFSFSIIDLGNIDSLSIPKGINQLSDKEIKAVYAYYRNSKAFFEKNEKEQMRDYLEGVLQPVVDQYLMEQQHTLMNHYENVLEKKFTFVRQHILNQISQYHESLYTVLSQEINIDLWLTVLSNIKKELKEV